MLTVEQVVCRRKAARRALAGHVEESIPHAPRITVDTEETAVVCDEQRIWQPRGRRERVLVRVEGYTGGVTRPRGVRRHIGKAHAGVLRTLDIAAIRAVSIAVKIIKLAVRRSPPDINDVGGPWGRPARHIIAALAGAVIERSKTGCGISRAGELVPAAIGAAGKQSPCRHICVVDSIKLRFKSRKVRRPTC